MKMFISIKPVIVSLFFIGTMPFWGVTQPVILKGNQLPPNAKEGTWYLDTIRHTVSYLEREGWTETNESIQYTDVFACNQLVILKVEGNHEKRIYVVEPTSNLNVRTSRFYCGKEILWTEFLDKHVVYYAGKEDRKEMGRAMTLSVHSACDTFKVDTLNGIEAFCMPSYPPGVYGRCEDFRNWGMLGTYGQWLIDPIYDAPFHFQNGIAEVLYYGQRRKINEKGEFVE